jgi:1,4-dihydroxy-2-naphthoate octaprenyltransferase
VIGYAYQAISIPAAFWYPLATLLLILPLTLIVATATTARELILALKLTSYTALAYSVLLALGLWKLF